MQNALLLDTHYQPLGVIHWQKAILLVLSEKAEVLKESSEEIHSVSITLKLPKVLRLLKNSYRKYQATFSKKAVFLRDRGLCAFCGEKLNLKNFTLDHVLPISRGGENDFENVVTACKTCNNKKGAKTPHEAGLKLLFEPKRPSRMELIEALIEHLGFKEFLKDIL